MKETRPEVHLWESTFGSYFGSIRDEETEEMPAVYYGKPLPYVLVGEMTEIHAFNYTAGAWVSYCIENPLELPLSMLQRAHINDNQCVVFQIPNNKVAELLVLTLDQVIFTVMGRDPYHELFDTPFDFWNAMEEWPGR